MPVKKIIAWLVIIALLAAAGFAAYDLAFNTPLPRVAFAAAIVTLILIGSALIDRAISWAINAIRNR